MAPLHFKRLLIRLGFWVLILIAIVAVVFMCFVTWGVYQKQKEAKREYDVQIESLGNLHSRKEALSLQLERLSTDRGVEEVVRKKFPVVKEGEEVIVLVDGEPGSEESAIEAKASVWDAIKSWFSW